MAGGARPRPSGSQRLPEGAIVHLLGEDRKALRALHALLRDLACEIACHATPETVRRAGDGRRGCLILLAGGGKGQEGEATLSLVEHLCTSMPDLPLILLTRPDGVCLAAEAMRRGAFYVLHRRCAADSLAARVAEALACICTCRSAACPGGAVEAPTRLAGLTERECAVFGEIVAGHTSKAAAQRLGISARTVETHRASIMRKTGAGNLADLIALARHAGG